MWEKRERFDKFDEWCSVHQVNIYKHNEITEDLPVDLPSFSTPIATSLMICQKISHRISNVQYAN